MNFLFKKKKKKKKIYRNNEVRYKEEKVRDKSKESLKWVWNMVLNTKIYVLISFIFRFEENKDVIWMISNWRFASTGLKAKSYL